ncbi:MAG: hypothetical protein SNG14_07085 [Rikenellaceae bacterium]
MMIKNVILSTLLAASIVGVAAQALPSDKAAKSYFKKLQSERVESSNYIDWVQVSPGTSGYNEMLWVHPTDSKTLITSPDMYNTFGSWDGGESWQTIKDCDAMGADVQLLGRIKCLAFSPTKPDYGVAMSSTGFAAITKDRGRSWVQASDVKVGKISAIAVDPTDERVWYAGTGNFWDVKKNHRNIKTLENPAIGVKGATYVAKSTDGGVTWTRKREGLPEGIEVGRIIVNPAKPKEIFIATNHGVFRSQNGGNSWALKIKGIPNCIVRDLDYHFDKRSGKFTLFLLDQTSYLPDGKGSIRSEGGVFRSDDSAESWVDITGNLAVDMTKITVRNFQSYQYPRTVTHWFDITGKEFNEKYSKRPESVLSVYNRIAVSPQNPNEIYISGNQRHDYGFAPGEVVKSNDGGKTWFVTARSGKYWIDNPDQAYWDSRKTPKGSNTKFAHLDSHVREAVSIFGNRFLVINIDGTVYGGFEQQVMRSTDRGESWEQFDDVEVGEGSNVWVGRGASNLPGRQILLETGVEGRHLFCSGEHGLWMNVPEANYPDKRQVAITQIEGQKNHGGATSPASVAVDPKNPDIIYTLQFRQEHRGHFRCSKDGGKTWANLSEPLPWNKKSVSGDRIFQNSLLVDYKETKNIYFLTTQNDQWAVPGGNFDHKKFPLFGMSRSRDGGLTWEFANTGLPELCSTSRLAMDVDNPNRLYVALNLPKGAKVGGGLYMTNNQGDKWEKMAIPSEIISVNNVFQDRNTKSLYISCGTTGGTAEAGGVWRSDNGGKSWTKIFFLPYMTQCETSPVDSNIITATAYGKANTDGNCGAYLSLDGGKTWMKVNKELGLQQTITDFKPDPKDTKKFWAALKGSGWTVGYATR